MNSLLNNKSFKEYLTVVIVSICIHFSLFLSMFTLVSFFENEAHLTYHKNIFEWSVSRWDSGIYIDICANGYEKQASYPESIMKYSFLPGLPLTICFFKLLTSNTVWGAVIASSIGFLFLSLVLYYFLKKRYKKRQTWYIFFAYQFFPFSIFLHIPYTESFFVGLLLLSFIFYQNSNNSKLGLSGLLMSLFRGTSPFVGLGYSLCYLIKQKIIKPIHVLLPLIFSFGTILSIIYFRSITNSWSVLFDSQSEYYGRSALALPRVLREILGTKMWYDLLDWNPITVTREPWLYTPIFRRIFYIWLPLVVTGYGSFLLSKKRKWEELTISMSIFIPSIVSSTQSINRFLLHLPFVLFIVFEEIENYKILKWVYLLISLLLCIMFTSLYTVGFWVG